MPAKINDMCATCAKSDECPVFAALENEHIIQSIYDLLRYDAGSEFLCGISVGPVVDGCDHYALDDNTP